LRTSSDDVESLVVSVHDAHGDEHFPGDETATYLRGLGIDREDDAGNPGPDGRIDRTYVFPSLGFIILPDLRPFAPAAADSVWPPFRADLPAGRPRFFAGEAANRAAYDKRTDAPDRPLDRRYSFDIRYVIP
jgi:hypothetical protein